MASCTLMDVLRTVNQRRDPNIQILQMMLPPLPPPLLPTAAASPTLAALVSSNAELRRLCVELLNHFNAPRTLSTGLLSSTLLNSSL